MSVLDRYILEGETPRHDPTYIARRLMTPASEREERDDIHPIITREIGPERTRELKRLYRALRLLGCAFDIGPSRDGMSVGPYAVEYHIRYGDAVRRGHISLMHLVETNQGAFEAVLHNIIREAQELWFSAGATLERIPESPRPYMDVGFRDDFSIRPRGKTQPYVGPTPKIPDEPTPDELESNYRV